MIDVNFFYNQLQNEGVAFFTGVPDSLLKDFCSYLESNCTKQSSIIAANEGNAVAIGIGHNLATKKIPLIYLQNSGLGNIINPLLSLVDTNIYSVPMLFLVGWRGHPEIADEPQHKKQGKVTENLITSMGYKYAVLDKKSNNDHSKTLLKEAFKEIRESHKPYFILVKKDTFAKYSFESNSGYKYQLSREKALHAITKFTSYSDIIVSTTGMTSRELYEIRAQTGEKFGKDFLTIGGMGHCSQIALGIAISKPNRNILCIDGDGSMIMHMGGLSIIGNQNCSNFKHIVINNGVHDSVGGQPTSASSIDIPNAALSMGYKWAHSTHDEKKLEFNIKQLLESDGPSLLEIKVSKGFRKNLGRPLTTPLENKISFTKFLNEE